MIASSLSELDVVSTAPNDIKRLVLQVAHFSEPIPASRTDRREHERKPYPHVLSVTPLIDGTLEPASETVSFIGRQISREGIDFFHDYLISEKRVAVGLQSASQSWAHFVLELGWSRFIKGGWYISGGRFTQVISWPKPSPYDVQRESF